MMPYRAFQGVLKFVYCTKNTVKVQGWEGRIGTQQIWKLRGRNSESEAICISEREHAEIRLVCLTERDVNNSASVARFLLSNEGQLEPTFFRFAIL